MTTNSFGGALPRFDYPTIQPVVRKVSRISGLAIPVRLMSVAAAAGFGKSASRLLTFWGGKLSRLSPRVAYYATSHVHTSKPLVKRQPISGGLQIPVSGADNPLGRATPMLQLRRDWSQTVWSVREGEISSWSCVREFWGFMECKWIIDMGLWFGLAFWPLRVPPLKQLRYTISLSVYLTAFWSIAYLKCYGERVRKTMIQMTYG